MKRAKKEQKVIPIDRRQVEKCVFFFKFIFQVLLVPLLLPLKNILSILLPSFKKYFIFYKYFVPQPHKVEFGQGIEQNTL